MRALYPLPILACLLLSGCGYKGPLYLPQDKPAEVKRDQSAAPDADAKTGIQQEAR